MKLIKLLNILSTVGVFLSLTSCDDYMYDPDLYVPSLKNYTLSVKPTVFNMSNEEERQQGSITAGTTWEFSDMADWVAITPNKGTGNSSFTVSADENVYFTAREAIFYLNSNIEEYPVSKVLSVSQRAATPYISVLGLEDNTLKVSSPGQEISVAVSTNLSTLNVSSNKSWCVPSYSYESKTLKLTLEAISSTASRSCTVTISSSYPSKTFTFTVEQSGAEMNIEDNSTLEFPGKGGSKKVTFNSNVPWKVEVGSLGDWVNISQTEGKEGTNTITVTALPSNSTYARSTTIYFYFATSSYYQKSLTIRQEGRQMYFDTSSVDFDYNGKPVGSSDSSSDSQTIVLHTDLNWNLSEWPDWVTLSPTQGGSGENVITISVSENNSAIERSGIIKAVSIDGGDISAQVRVSQTGVTFGDQASVEFGWQSGSQKIQVPFPNEWSANISDGWISLSSYQGEGPMELTVSVTRNESENLRKGNVNFTSEGKSYTVSVLQQGQYIKLETENSSFDANGGSLNLTFVSSISVIPSVEYSGSSTGWVTFMKKENGSYDLIVSYNPSTEQREAYFILKPSEETSSTWASGVKFKITQKGRSLSVTGNTIPVFAKGGTTEVYHIVADGPYSISKSSDADWFTLVYNDKTNSFYLVVTENISDTTREGTIEVSLKDLPEGEEKVIRINVIQKSIYDSEIIFEDYEEDQIL